MFEAIVATQYLFWLFIVTVAPAVYVWVNRNEKELTSWSGYFAILWFVGWPVAFYHLRKFMILDPWLVWGD